MMKMSAVCAASRFRNSPAQLFQGGVGGVWFDPSDLSTLFQDSAGTIPVTASGQPVGRMLDKSGNGFHALQPTAAYRPTLQIEDGRPYLQFDGVDDRFNITTPNPTDLTFTSKTIFIGLNHTSAIASGTRVFFGRGVGNWYLGLGSGRMISSHSNAAAAQKTIYHGSVINTNFPYVVTCGWVVDGQNVTVFNRQNGELKTPSVAMPLTDGISTSGNTTWALGSFTQSGAFPIPAHRFYGLVLHGAQSSAAQIAATERWLAAKVGATLG